MAAARLSSLKYCCLAWGLNSGGKGSNYGTYASEVEVLEVLLLRLQLERRLPISPHISPYLLSPHISPYLPISPHISLLLLGLQLERP